MDVSNSTVTLLLPDANIEEVLIIDGVVGEHAEHERPVDDLRAGANFGITSCTKLRPII